MPEQREYDLHEEEKLTNIRLGMSVSIQLMLRKLQQTEHLLLVRVIPVELKQLPHDHLFSSEIGNVRVPVARESESTFVETADVAVVGW